MVNKLERTRFNSFAEIQLRHGFRYYSLSRRGSVLLRLHSMSFCQLSSCSSPNGTNMDYLLYELLPLGQF